MAGLKKGQRNGGSFKPGNRANPGGRPKKTDEMRRIEDAAKEYSEAALRALADEAQNGSGAPRVAASVALLDRAWGKAVERSEQGRPGDFRPTPEIEKSATERFVKLGIIKAQKKAA